MLLQSTCCLALVAALTACSTDSATSPTRTATPPAAAQLPSALPGAELIDSSDYVLYPLTLSETLTEESGEYGSSSNRSSAYWNIVFSNVRTGESHLLSEAKKMLILAYTGTGLANSSGNLTKEKARPKAADQLLYYSVVTDDFNHDGKLTSEDATYLFISDKAGNHLRQLSPDSLHVSGWQIQRTTGKILLQTVADSNHDRRFGTADESIPYVVDVATGQPATRAISPEFMQRLKLKFQQQWPKP